MKELLSLGKSAKLSGLSRWDFIEYLGSNGIPVIDSDDDEIYREFDMANNITETRLTSIILARLP